MASADIIVNLVTKTAKFESGMRRANRHLRGTAKAARLFTTALRVAGTVVAGIGISHLVRQNLDLLDSYNKLNDRLGISVEAISALGFAAEQTGVQQRQLELGLQRMTRRISEAAEGIGEAQPALRELRLDAEELNKLPIEQQFAIIADRMQLVEGQSNRVRLAFKLFDAEGVSLLQTMKGGSKALQDYATRATELGVVFDKQTVEQATKAKDSINELKAAFGALATNLVAEVSPALARFAEDTNTILFGTELAKLTLESRRINEAIRELSKIGENDPGFAAQQEVITALLLDLRYVSDQIVSLRSLMQVQPAGETIIGSINKETEDAITLVTELGGRISEVVSIDAIRTTGEFFAQLRKDAKESEEFAKDLGFTFSSAFEDAIIEGRKLSDVLEGLLKDIARMILRRTVTQPLGNFVGDLFTTRAVGGPVSGGQPYIVGERGPELFSPSVSGHITPNHQLGRGGGGMVVNNYRFEAGADIATIRAEIIPMLEQNRLQSRSEWQQAKSEGRA